MPRYGLPSDTNIAQDVTELCQYWQPQKEIYQEIQKHLRREHSVTAPDETSYEIRKVLLGRYRAHLNERLSRFLPVPRIRVLPDDLTSDSEAFASQLEKSIAEMRRQLSLTNDSWGLALTDVLTCEEGWELYEPYVSSAWPELIPGEDNKDSFTRMLGDTDAAREARMNYKRERPLPVTSRYVPLSSMLPIPDYNLYEAYEYGEQSLNSVLGNPLFSKEGRDAVRKAFGEGGRASLTKNVSIVYYCNCDTYGYYAVGTTDATSKEGIQPGVTTNGMTGTPILLHSYEHGIGENLYNPIMGAHGGWMGGGRDFIKGRVQALLDLETYLDTIASQAMTNLGETWWPTLVVARNIERPGSGIAMDPSEAELLDGLSRKTGHDINIYTGESITPLFEPKANPLFESLFQKFQQSFDMIGGSSSLYGIHQPGVETGYQEENMRTQSESQFARVESGIAKGAITGTIKALAIIRETGEDCVIRQPRRKNGRMTYEEYVIRPEDLKQMPLLDAQVRAPRPIDLPVQIRAFKEAVAPVNGPGTQAMSVRQARQNLLGDEHPDETALLVKAEEQEQQFWASDIPQQIMAQKLGLAQLSEIAGEVTDAANAAMQADPGMTSQLTAFVNNTAPVGASEGMGQGAGGGALGGQPQPEQAQGRAAQIQQDMAQ